MHLKFVFVDFCFNLTFFVCFFLPLYIAASLLDGSFGNFSGTWISCVLRVFFKDD